MTDTKGALCSVGRLILNELVDKRENLHGWANQCMEEAQHYLNANDFVC